MDEGLYIVVYNIKPGKIVVVNLELTTVALQNIFKVVRDPCQKIILLLLKSKSIRVIVPESCF